MVAESPRLFIITNSYFACARMQTHTCTLLPTPPPPTPPPLPRQVGSPRSWLLRGRAGDCALLSWPAAPEACGHPGAPEPVLRPLLVERPAGAGGAGRVVHNSGAAPAAPAGLEPDGRFLWAPDSVLQVGLATYN